MPTFTFRLTKEIESILNDLEARGETRSAAIRRLIYQGSKAEEVLKLLNEILKTTHNIERIVQSMATDDDSDRTINDMNG